MELGFETIGNATVVPVLVTDPWLTPTPTSAAGLCLTRFPEEQLRAIRQCKYAWISHGHPDHPVPYRRRALLDYFRHLIEVKSRQAVMRIFSAQSLPYRALAKAYHFAKSF
jgi:hypothetical protein